MRGTRVTITELTEKNLKDKDISWVSVSLQNT